MHSLSSRSRWSSHISATRPRARPRPGLASPLSPVTSPMRAERESSVPGGVEITHRGSNVWLASLPLGRWARHFPNVSLLVDQSHAVDNAAAPSVKAQDNVACLDVLGDHRPMVRERDGGCDQRARDDNSDCLLVHGRPPQMTPKKVTS